MAILGKKEALEEIRSAIHNKIFGSNTNLSFLEKIKHPFKQTQILSLLGAVFKKREEQKIRHFMADIFAGEIVEIADNDNETFDGSDNRENVARAKLRIDTRKWLMEQFAPHLYGSGKVGKVDKSASSIFSTRVYLPENGRS
ncbi:MAG: hypothetical protein JKY12_05845 [Sneathiella sp.]|nr:hypothetical protein [Sneathiella sp.]